MKRKNVIVVITPALQIECWGNLKKVCIAHGWAYNSMVKLKMPIEYKGYRIERVPFL